MADLWASWCVPCKREMPRLRATAARAGSEVLFLGVDVEDDLAAAGEWLARVGVRYRQVRDPDGQLLADLRLPGIPLTYALDGAGVVTYRHVGQMQAKDIDDLESALSASR